MKNKLICLMALLSVYCSFSQNPQLIENTWYLEKLVINGDDVFHPVNSEMWYVDLRIEIDELNSHYCNDYSCNITDITNSTISRNLLFMLPQN